MKLLSFVMLLRKRTRSLPVFDMGEPRVDIANRNQLSEAMEQVSGRSLTVSNPLLR
jgi:hypothetical protein